MKSFKLIVLLLFVCQVIYAQNSEALKAINTEIWKPFTKAFETSDYQLFASIHAPSLIRVSGNQKSIRSFNSYMEGYKKRWENAKANQSISFRFFERIAGEDLASERGIYRFTVDPGLETERHFYGQFHVLHRKSNGVWKIILDYDSDEKNTINKASYDAAYAIDDFKRF